MIDIFNSDINECVVSQLNIEDAAREFQTKFLNINDFHAPIKTFQIRKHFLLYMSNETKQLIRERNVLKEEATITGNATLLRKFKIKAKDVKESIKFDLKAHNENQRGVNASTGQAWKAAKEALGIKTNLSPTSLIHNGVIITSPKHSANLFNTFLIEKVKLMRTQTASVPNINSIDKLQKVLYHNLD